MLSVPADWLTLQPTRAADGLHVIEPRFTSVPAPTFVTVTTVGAVVPPVATDRFTMLAFKAMIGCRIVRFTVTFCGLLNPPTALTGTCTSVGLVVRPVGLAVKTSVSGARNAQLSHAVG